MSEDKSPNYWVFSNRHEGYYNDNIWDMSTILRTNQYSYRKREGNRAHVKPGDVVYMRVYGQSYIGRFVIDGEWIAAPEDKQEWDKTVVGTFPMRDVKIWSRPLPQNLVIGDLSNQNIRRRIARITHDDATIIETAKRVYERLLFGGADGEIVILEKGLEEALKPNLEKLGLKLGEQQLPMGVGVGRSDLICTNENDDLVVIELKRGMSSDQAIGQVLRYVGWVKENIAKDGQEVHGWIVAGDYDEHLRLAASAAGIKLLLVRLA